MLEAECGRGCACAVDERRILDNFNMLMGLADVKLEDLQAVNTAVSWCGNGLGFTDARHSVDRHPKLTRPRQLSALPATGQRES